MSTDLRINHQIRAPEVRVIGSQGENLGVLSLKDALVAAEKAGLDLIEVASQSKPPVARIADYGKYRYELAKKEKESRAGSKTSELKSLQVKIGTGDHDLALKAKKAGQFLREGNRVKIELFLRGRAKYMEQEFLKERLERVLNLIPEEYKVAENLKKGPKGLYVIIEKAKK